jgi:hypothetical protein
MWAGSRRFEAPPAPPGRKSFCIDDDKRIAIDQLDCGSFGATHYEISLRSCVNASVLSSADSLGAGATSDLPRPLRLIYSSLPGGKWRRKRSSLASIKNQ